MMNDKVALVIAAALIGFFWLAARTLRDDTHAARGSEADLLVICQRDPARAERLIDLELRRAPEISRTEAIRRAIERHRRDNR